MRSASGLLVLLSLSVGCGAMSLRQSTVAAYDTSGIAIVLVDYSGLDAGTSDSPGMNTLTSGGIALQDLRAAYQSTITIYGTTINGVLFQGTDSVTGPAADDPYYYILRENTISGL